MRGLGLPACGSGVTVPISTKPNPRANKAGYMRPSLSNPAASPIGLFTVFPKSFVCRTGKSSRNCRLKNGITPGIFETISTEDSILSCAVSASPEKKRGRS